MSNSAPIQDHGRFYPVYGAGKQVEVSVAVKDAATGKWKTLVLKDEEKKILANRVLETVYQRGQGQRGGEWVAFEQSGAVIELTDKNVYVKQGREWKDILNDPQVKGTTRAEVKKTLASVTSVLGDLSTTSDKTELKTSTSSQELQRLAGKGDVVIEFKVIDIADSFNKYLNQERQFHQTVVDLKNRTTTNQFKGALISAGYEKDQIKKIKNAANGLAEASEGLLGVIDHVNTLLAQGDANGASDYYIENMPDAYGVYCDALREWQKFQGHLNLLLGDQNPYKIDTQHLFVHFATAQSIFPFLWNYAANKRNASNAIHSMQKFSLSFEHFLNLQIESSKKIELLKEKEEKFNAHLSAAIEEFNKPDFVDKMTSWWSREHINLYKEQLIKIKELSGQMLETLETSTSYIYGGQIQEGIDYYLAMVERDFEVYEEACRELILDQKKGYGRTLLMPIPSRPFSLELDHLKHHTLFLQDITSAVNRANIVDVDSVKVIDDRGWQEDLDAMTEGTELLTQEMKFRQVALHLNDSHQRSLKTTAAFGTFVKAYQEHREHFEAIMRAEGFSDLESAFIFNVYYEAHQALQEWDKKFQVIVDLANQKQDDLAMEKFATLIDDEYANLITKVIKINYSVNKRNKLDTALEKFLTSLAIPEPRMIPPLLQTEVITKKKLVFRDCIKYAVDEKVLDGTFDNVFLALDQKHQAITNAWNTSTREAAHADATINDFETIFVQDNRFFKFFNHNHILQSSLQGTWKGLLKKYGWSLKEINSFTDLYNDYAAAIQQLKEGEQAVANEFDPQKKRALGIQLKELAKKLMPKIQKLHREFNRLGGLRKLNSIILMEEDIVSGAHIQQQKALKKLQKEFEKNTNKYIELGFHSVESLVEGLENYLRSKEPLVKERFAKESGLIHEIQLTKGLMQEANELVGLMDERIRFLDKMYVKLGLAAGEEIGSVNEILLGGPHSRDKKFLSFLESRYGWKEKDIREFSQWYDSYLRISLPIVQVKAALDADPENWLLQEELKRVATAQIPKLKKLDKEFSEKIGGFARLEELEWAISIYGNRVAKDHQSLVHTLNTQDLTTKYRSQIEKQVEDLDFTLAMFSAVNFSAILTERGRLIADVTKITSAPMSWDNDYLTTLFNPQSLIFGAVSGKNISLWKQFLEQNGLTLKDVQTIVHLHQKYQKALHRMLMLERMLEAHPEDQKLRTELSREMKRKKAELQALEEQYVDMAAKIADLQTAMDDFAHQLSHALEEIQVLEKISKNEEIPANRNNFERQAELVKKQQAGGLSNESIQETIDMLQELHVVRAFNQKISFQVETYHRFTL